MNRNESNAFSMNDFNWNVCSDSDDSGSPRLQRTSKASKSSGSGPSGRAGRVFQLRKIVA